MGKHPIVLTLMVAMLATGAVSWAQAPGGGAAVQGFNVTLLIAQLSIYLPEEATQGMYPRRGGEARAQGGQSGQSAAQGAGSAAAQGGLRQRFQIDFTRDPKLFLTKEQVAGLLPIMTALKDSPMPTPSKAKKVQADVDAILTAAQKTEYAQFQKKVQKLIESFRQQMGASAGSGAGAGAFGAGEAAQGQGAQAGQAGGTGQGGTQMTVLQRRQRQVEAFIKVLQDRQSQLGA
jgi:hypothetical protein